MSLKLALFYFLMIIAGGLNGINSLLCDGDYYKIEEKAMKETIGIESAVKIQYETSLSVDEELDRIIQKYKGNYQVQDSNLEGKLILIGEYKLEFNIWEENNIVFVEGIISDSKNNNSTKDLKNELKKLQNNNIKSVRYFNYYKGKISSQGQSLKELDFESIPIKDMIKIENGYTGKVKLNDGTKLNFSIVEYDTGIHLIIGTPIIFATY